MEQNQAAFIILSHRKGSDKALDLLINHLIDPKVKEDLLIQTLLGLKDCTSLISQDTEHLVGVLLKVAWHERSDEVVRLYKDFIANLVSAQTMYLKSCVKMLFRHFNAVVKPTANTEPGVVSVASEQRERDKRKFAHCHDLLRRVSATVPATSSIVLDIATGCFPYVEREPYLLACYVENLLTVVTYLPSLRPQILELIVENLMKLDVRSPRDVIGVDSDDEEEEDDEDDDESGNEMDMFEMENLDDDDMAATTESGDVMDGGDALAATTSTSSGAVGDDDDEATAAESTPKPMSLKEANSLDLLMSAMFEFIHSTCYRDGEFDWEATKKLYRELLLIFQRLIIPTHASSHVQYVMFYICSFQQKLAEGFLQYLWKKLSSPSSQAIFRQKAVIYMASLLARAKYIDISLVKEYLLSLSTWALSYIQRTSETCTLADVEHHGPFYTVCQALFYVFAFRHKQLFHTEDGYRFSQKLHLQTIVTCRLNPLRICLPIVVRTFATITRNYRVAYCDSIMEKNRRMTIPEAAHDASRRRVNNALNQLDSFFPFDPYLLVRSKRFILSIYQEFDGSVDATAAAADGATDVINEDDIYDDALVSANGGGDGSNVMQQFDFRSDVSASRKALLMATSPTDLFMHSISPGYKVTH